jgi:hypothetical protein
MTDTAAAGGLAGMPARGLAAAIAEAGRIEVPSANPAEAVVVHAAQASRWTEGSYDVWHLTGGVRIEQQATEATGHEAVVWIEQESAAEIDGGESEGPRPRSMLVRMAGNVRVQSAAADAESTSSIRGDRWTGRFWTLRDPRLEFDSVVPASGTPPIYEAPAEGAVQTVAGIDAANPKDDSAADGTGEDVRQAQFSEFAGQAAPPREHALAAARAVLALLRHLLVARPRGLSGLS